jgi:hypothetical protein
MLHLVGCRGQDTDTGPSKHSHATVAAVAAICVVAVPKYNNALAASGVHEDAIRRWIAFLDDPFRITNISRTPFATHVTFYFNYFCTLQGK